MTINVFDVVCDAGLNDEESHEFLIYGLTKLVRAMRNDKLRNATNIPIDALEGAMFNNRYDAGDVADWLNRLGSDAWENYDRDDDPVESHWSIRRTHKSNGA